jgi:hypothetical protein
MGLNESAGYLTVALTALLTGNIAAHAGLRPEPFLLGVAYGALGLGLSTIAVHETRSHAAHEAAIHPDLTELTDRQVFAQTSFREPALSSASQAGLVNDLNDGLAWGLFPVLFTSAGLTLGQTGTLVALYPAVWGLGQLATAALSDRWGRKHLITGGMLLQAVALALIATSDTVDRWAIASVLLDAGTAMVYPPCSPVSATSPTPTGEHARSVSTDSGATWDSPSARSSPECRRRLRNPRGNPGNRDADRSLGARCRAAQVRDPSTADPGETLLG